jgi:hypothetical protein
LSDQPEIINGFDDDDELEVIKQKKGEQKIDEY